jgi:hypothetical protein
MIKKLFFQLYHVEYFHLYSISKKKQTGNEARFTCLHMKAPVQKIQPHTLSSLDDGRAI